MQKISPRDIQILQYIRECICFTGTSPTLREIGQKLKIKSVGVVARHVKRLKDRGWLRTDGRRARGVVPVGLDAPEIAGIPMAVATVPGGNPQFIDDECQAVPENVVWLDRRWVRSPRDVFSLRVKGNSMKGAGIIDGDVVIVKKQDSAQGGDVVVAVVECKATMKRYCPQEDAIYLRPANDSFNPIKVAYDDPNFRIVGKVIKRFGDVH